MSGLGVLAHSIDNDLNYEIAMLFICTGTNKSRQSHFISKKAYLHFSKFNVGNWERGWSQVTFLDTKTPAKQFNTKVELPPILPSYPRLKLEIFIADMFHTVAGASSIIFDLRRQFFAKYYVINIYDNNKNEKNISLKKGFLTKPCCFGPI